MGKVGKTFTCDMKVLMWLEQYAKKEHKKESAIVNAMLNAAMRQHQTWECSVCHGSNHNDNESCYANPDCKGVKA